MLVTHRLVLASAFTVILGIPVQAQEHEKIEHGMTEDLLKILHGKIDNDGDGKVSLQEAMDAFQKSQEKIFLNFSLDEFKDLDLDGDRKVTITEVDAKHANFIGDEEIDKELEEGKKLNHAKFNAADKNKDGVLDASEFEGFAYPELHEDVLDIVVDYEMKRLDTDGSGKLSLHEFFEREEVDEVDKKEFKHLDKDGDDALDKIEVRVVQTGFHHNEQMLLDIFEVSDKDKDKHLTADELASAQKELEVDGLIYHLRDLGQHSEF